MFLFLSQNILWILIWFIIEILISVKKVECPKHFGSLYYSYHIRSQRFKTFICFSVSLFPYLFICLSYNLLIAHNYHIIQYATQWNENRPNGYPHINYCVCSNQINSFSILIYWNNKTSPVNHSQFTIFNVFS